MRSSYRSVHLVAFLVASLGLTLIGSVRAATEPSSRFRAFGGPDDSGYQFIDSFESDGPVFATEWEDISTSGTAITWTAYDTWAADDEGEAQISLGFTFPFYGNSYTDCWVNTNGFVKFGASTVPGSTAYNPVATPTAGGDDNKICARWRDWIGTSARYQILGTTPNQRLVVHWTLAQESVELKLYENGNFVVLIQSTGGNSNGTIGIENGTATLGLPYSFNGSPNRIVGNLAIRFVAGPAPTINLGAPTLAQFASDGTTPLAIGGDTVVSSAVLNATLANATGSARRVQIEVRPTSQGFTGTATHTGASTSGDELTVRLSHLTKGLYHWRARAFEPSTGFVSDWVAFGGNDNPSEPTDPNGATDFEVPIGVGGPDAFGYTFVDDRAVNGPVYASELEDLSVIGTPTPWVAYDTYPANDEGEALLSLGFSFPFYGNTYTDCWVNTNGFVKFGSPTVPGSAARVHQTIPTDGGQDNFIAAKWVDSGGPTSHYASLGTSPNRRFVVTWSINGGQEIHHLKLYEDGTIILMTYSSGGNSSGTVGTENSTGNVGLLYAYDGVPNTVTGRTIAIKFVPPVLAIPPPPPPPAPPPSGGGGSSGRCGSVGLDLMAPLVLLSLWRRFKRRGHRDLPHLPPRMVRRA